MIDSIEYCWKLKKLHSALDKTSRCYKRLIREAKERGDSPEELGGLGAEGTGESMGIKYEIDLLETSYLLKQAERLMLPTPDLREKEMWEKGPFTAGRSVLTASGISYLRKSIRQEQKERRDKYIPWIIAISGLIVVLTGLFAVILR